MSENEHHEGGREGGVKVSDRRHFTGSGERREGVEPVVGPPPEAPKAAATPPAASTEPDSAKAPSAAAPAPSTPPPPSQPRLAAREINFAGLLQDLFATGRMQLGAEIQPGQRGQLDLEGARETIDLLGVLQQKTHGNLDPQEQQLMTAALYELRLGYVEVQRAATARVKIPPPPGRK